MLQSFKNPPPEFRVAPFWFWNYALDQSEIERQIREMHAQGVGGFFVHGRFGLKTEYMSEEWVACIDRCCQVARELGMHVYLYDENPFPSGVAGGEGMKDVKHFNKYLDIARLSASQDETVRVTVPEGKLLSAVAISLDDPSVSIDLTDSVSDGEVVWTAEKAHYEILVFVEAVARYPGFIYGSEPDYFEQSLTDLFFSHTHERYTRRLKPWIGTVIKGIFTDEPKIQCIYHMHEDGNTTAWFADILEQFRTDHGYDLLPNLACLVADRGPDTGKVRRDFWSTVTDRYIQRYFARYRAWCEEHGVALTGHLFLEEGLYANTIYQGNFPRVLSEFHIPGVDHLGLSAESSYGMGNLPRSITRTHGQKLASSVAHTQGPRRVLSETFGCCGWALSMERMKWITDWQYSLGINMLCPHAFYYSISGVRKTDAPPSQFYQATYWPHYRLFADYAARLSYALSLGTHRAQAAILYPAKGFQSEWAPGTQGRLDRLISDYFDVYCAYLLREHIDYDILTEDDLRRAAVADQCLVLSDERYELLIMPPTTAIGCQTAEKIREFVDDGGKVLATMLLPTEDADGDNHTQVREVFATLFDADPVTLRQNALAGAVPVGESLTTVDHCAFLFQGPDPKGLARVLRETVCKAIRPDVSILWGGSECHDILCVRRLLAEGEIWFFSNSAEEPRDVEITVRCDQAPHVLDAETGDVLALPGCTQRGSRTIFAHRFERFGSLLVYFGDAPALAVGGDRKQSEGREVTLSEQWEFRCDRANCLTLRSWDLGIVTQQDAMLYEYSACFEAQFVPDDLVLVLDDMPEVGSFAGCAGSSCRVSVNGAEATDSRPWVLDVGFQAISIGSLTKPGTNHVKVTIEHGGWSGEPQLMLAEPRIMGSFALDPAGVSLIPPPKHVRPGSWTDQGYPEYAGTGVYSQTVDIPKFARDERVLLRALDPADAVEFVVNGASVGTRAWAPFEAEITHLVKPGPNLVEIKVTNSLANLITGDARPSGLLSGARIVIAA